MNKNILLGVSLIILAIVLGVIVYLYSSNKKNEASMDNNVNFSNKVLVVYYSAQGHTEELASKIANNLNADLFKVEPVEEYTSSDLNYNDSSSRVSKEHEDESLRNIKLKNTRVDNFDSYDTVLIGYPIWWGVAAWPINNFVKENDFTNKTVIPFCTSASSGIGNSDKLLKELTTTGNWKDGVRFSSSAGDSDIKTFTDSIK